MTSFNLTLAALGHSVQHTHTQMTTGCTVYIATGGYSQGTRLDLEEIHRVGSYMFGSSESSLLSPSIYYFSYFIFLIGDKAMFV